MELGNLNLEEYICGIKKDTTEVHRWLRIEKDKEMGEKDIGTIIYAIEFENKVLSF